MNSRRVNPRIIAMLLLIFVGAPLALLLLWHTGKPTADDYVKLGRTQLEHGDYDAARATFALSLQESPGHRAALEGIADALENRPVLSVEDARNQLAEFLETRLRIAESAPSDCQGVDRLLAAARRAAAQPSTTYPWDNVLLITNSLLRRIGSAPAVKDAPGCPLTPEMNLRLHRLAAQTERMTTVELTESELSSLDADAAALRGEVVGETTCLRSQVLALYAWRAGRQRGGEAAVKGRLAALELAQRPLEPSPRPVEALLMKLRVLVELRTEADLAAAREVAAALEPIVIASPLDRGDARRNIEMLAFADILLALHAGDMPGAVRRADAVLNAALRTRAVGFARARLLGITEPDQMLDQLLLLARPVPAGAPPLFLADTEAARAASLDLAPLALHKLQSLMSARKLDDAEDLLRRAAVVFPPDDARLEMAAIRLLSLRGQHDKAQAAFDAMTQRRAGIPAASLEALRGFVLHLAGKPEPAETAYRRALAESPDDAQALNNLAFLLLAQPGRAAEALPLAERAFKLTPKNPEVLDTLRAAKLANASTRPATQAR